MAAFVTALCFCLKVFDSRHLQIKVEANQPKPDLWKMAFQARASYQLMPAKVLSMGFFLYFAIQIPPRFHNLIDFFAFSFMFAYDCGAVHFLFVALYANPLDERLKFTAIVTIGLDAKSYWHYLFNLQSSLKL